MKTLASVYDLDTINYYAQINFTGFETLIDQIGGVTVNSEQAFSHLWILTSFQRVQMN